MIPNKPPPSFGPAVLSLRHSRAIILIVIGLSMAGGIALFTLASGIYPNVAFPRIVIIAERGGESVENFMVKITRPLEQATSVVQGIKRVRSKTIRGACEISLDFLPSTDMQQALSRTRTRAFSATSALSRPVSLSIERQTPSVFPVISYNISLDPNLVGRSLEDGADLLNWTKLVLKPRISRLPDVFLVTVQGSDIRQVIVEADPAKLATASLTLDDLASAIRDANRVAGVGLIEKDYQQFQIIATGELKTAEAVAGIPVRAFRGGSVRIGDLARVYTGIADRTSVVTGDGKNAVVFSIFMRYGGKITELSRNVRKTLADENLELPMGVSIAPVYDQADLVNDSISGVRDAILIGMLLTVGVLWIFLRSWRLTFATGISIPISVLATFAVMSALGRSLNLMSLGGIAIAIGLIIDDAIVVVENIARKIDAGLDRRSASIEGTQEIFGAVVGSSLTTVVVFVPMILLQGVVGQFFKALALALAIAIIASMIISLTLIPILTAGIFGLKQVVGSQQTWIDRVAAFYERVIRKAMRRPLASVAILFLIIGLGALPTLRQATGFLPEMDEGAFVLDYYMPVGTSLSETDKNCRKIEAILMETPGVASYSRRTGLELGFFATEQFTGDFLVGLDRRSQRNRSSDVIIDEIRGRIATEVPQIEVEFVQVMQDTLNDLSGNPAPLEVKVFGSDYHVLQNLASRIEKRMKEIAGIVDVKSGVSFGNPEMVFEIDAEAAARSGLSSETLEREFNLALLGMQATELRQGELLVPVWVRYPDAFRHDPAWLENLPIGDSEGRLVPASLFSRLREKRATNELARENQQPVVAVTARLAGVDLGSAAKATRAMLREFSGTSGVRIELGGQVASQSAAFRRLVLALGLAAGLVFLLLVIQFNSYKLPLIIFMTLPPSQIGALLALRLTGTPLNIASFMGLVMLIGLVVKNGIIFVEYTAQLRKQGVPTLAEALATAGRVRLRPILMTSLTAIIAMLPLAFNLGAGAELQRPLAIAVIGGLSVSTAFTLLLVPVAHLLLGEQTHLDSTPEGAITQ